MVCLRSGGESATKTRERQIREQPLTPQRHQTGEMSASGHTFHIFGRNQASSRMFALQLRRATSIQTKGNKTTSEQAIAPSVASAARCRYAAKPQTHTPHPPL